MNERVDRARRLQGGAAGRCGPRTRMIGSTDAASPPFLPRTGCPKRGGCHTPMVWYPRLLPAPKSMNP